MEMRTHFIQLVVMTIIVKIKINELAVFFYFSVKILNISIHENISAGNEHEEKQHY